MKRSVSKLLSSLIACVFAGFLWNGVVAATTPPPPSERRLGDVSVVNGNAQGESLDHGDQNTVFSLRVPDPATCPGDSQHDSWRVETFLIAADHDPVDIEYGPVGPDPPGASQVALYDVNHRPYTSGLLNANDAAGQPAKIPGLPPFKLVVAADLRMPSGTYRTGVACTYFGETLQYWDVQVIVTDTLDGAVGDTPTSGEFTWRLASAAADVTHLKMSNDNHWLTPVVAVVVALVLLAVLWRARARGSRPQTPTPAKEST